jgi:zinc-ribbon domain
MNWKLITGHELSIDNEGAQTVVTLHYDRAGQQQRACNSFTTGIWLAPPQMTVTPTGALLKVVTASGESLIEIQGNDMQLHSSNSLNNYATTASSYSSSSTGTNSHGSTGINTGAATSQSQRFCTECGAPVKPTDKFCASCGTKLT